jgi:hypothetical protein
LIIELHPRNAEQLADIADVLTEVLKFGQEHGIPATVASAGTTDGDAVDALLPPAGGATPPPAPSPEPTAATGPKRVRDRTAERRAKREREAAEAAAAAGNPKGNGQAADPAEPDDADPFGDLDAGFLPPGSPEPAAAATKPPVNPILAKVRTEQGAMDAALTILRCVYDSPDGAKHVKELQKAHKVAKFTDVPLDAAPVLFKTAFALADKLGVALPSGL